MAEIRLVSDGTREGTNLFIDGVRATGIQSLVWKFDIRDPHPVIRVKFLAVTPSGVGWDLEDAIYEGNEHHIEIDHISKIYEMGSKEAIGIAR